MEKTKKKKFALYKKIKESSSKEYLIAYLFSLGKVYEVGGWKYFDTDYEIREVDDES